MSTLYLSEYAALNAAGVAGNVLPAAQEPAVVNQAIAIGAASTQSAAFGSSTRFVRLHPDAVCSVRFGASPTATTGDARMVAGQTEFFDVTPGMKVAVIQNL